MKYLLIHILPVLKLVSIVLLVLIVTVYSLYYFLLHPQNLSEKTSIPAFYPNMEWKLVSKGTLDYPSDFSQGTLSLYSSTFYASDPNPTTKNQLLNYYRNKLIEEGWYEMQPEFYDSPEVIGYFSKLPYKNVQSKFAYIPYKRRFFRIKTLYNDATHNYEYIIEYNTQLEDIIFK